MKTLIVIPLTCLALAAGCASSDKVRRAESTSETNQKLLRETDYRLRTLEQSVTTLDTQVAQLNNRVYEVRTRSGQKTGMTVVPIIPPQPYKSAVATPAQPDAHLTANGPVAVPTAEFAAGQQAANGAATPAAASQNAAQSNGRPSIAVASTSTTSGATSGTTPGSSSARSSGGVPVIGSASNSGGDPAATIRPIPAAPQRDVASAAAETAPQQVAAKAAPEQPAPAVKPLTKAEARAAAKAEAKAAADAAKAEAAAAKAAAKSAPTPSATSAPTPAGNASAATSFALPPEAATPAKPATAVQPMLPPVAAAGGNADVPVPAIPQSDLALPPEVPGLVPPLPGETAAPAAKNGASQNAAKAAPAPAAPALAPAAAATQPASLPKSGKGEEAAYKAALQPAMAGRPAESIGRFQTFLQEYPHGRFAANAEYWIGEGLYAQGKYGEALAQFQKVNSQWSSHHKNADALLKTGMTLSRMGDKEGAAQAYKKLLSQFPNSEAAGIARSRGLAR